MAGIKKDDLVEVLFGMPLGKGKPTRSEYEDKFKAAGIPFRGGALVGRDWVSWWIPLEFSNQADELFGITYVNLD